MLSLRPAAARGHFDHGWLQTWHSFSFADYYDPAEMGWGALRVINDDVVAPGTGFGMHGHRDMEIVTYVLSGQLEHRDSLGNGAVIRAGEVQRMTAGRGILHSEVNPDAATPVRLLQIWIQPQQRGRTPGYEQMEISAAAKHNRLYPVATPEGAQHQPGSLAIGQDARLFASIADAGLAQNYELAAGRCAYVHLVSGALEVLGADGSRLDLQPGDAAKVAPQAAPGQLTLTSGAADSEFLLFDLPSA